MMQKLILVGELGENEVTHVIAGLAVASYPGHLQVINLQPKTATPQSEVEGIAEPLLSLAEVHVSAINHSI